MNDNSLIDTAFSTSGAGSLPADPGPDCPSEGFFSGYIDKSLTATEMRHIEEHALVCAGCHGVLKAMVDLRELPTASSARLSVVARVVQRGLELLNPLEVSLRSLTALDASPDLGAIRGSPSDMPEVISIDGPGQGLDEVQIRLQPDGQIRLEVRGDDPPPVYSGEIASVILEVDGKPREKRPFSGAPLAFSPQDQGCYRIRLLARAPGEEARELSETLIELRA